MGRLFTLHLRGDCVYCCGECGVHLASSDEVVSTAFRGRSGPAWLFNRVVNVSESAQQEDRLMTTGLHTIVDCYCVQCANNLGWRYVEAYEESQKYKKGRFILERALITPVDTLSAEASPSARSVSEGHVSAASLEDPSGDAKAETEPNSGATVAAPAVSEPPSGGSGGSSGPD